MKDKKIIVLDLDGTLLSRFNLIHSFPYVHPDNVYAIKHLLKKHIIIVATGRHWRSAINIYDYLELNSFIVASNGSTIINPKQINKDFVIFNNTLDSSVCKQIANDEVIKKNIWLFGTNTIWKTYFSDHFSYCDYINIQLEINIDNYEIFDPFSFDYKSSERLYLAANSKENAENMFRHLQKKYSKFLKFHLAFFPNRQNLILNMIKQKNKDYQQYIDNDSQKKYFDLYIVVAESKKISKYEGVRKICKYYKLPLTSVIAFGDADNDISMTKFNDFIMMKNATKQLINAMKAKYKNDLDGYNDHITFETSDHGGVGKFLIEWFKLSQI